MCARGEVTAGSFRGLKDKDRLYYFLSHHKRQKAMSCQDGAQTCSSALHRCIHTSAQRQQDTTCDKHTKLVLPADVRGF